MPKIFGIISDVSSNGSSCSSPTYRKEMKGLPWGIYYNRYHKNTYDHRTTY